MRKKNHIGETVRYYLDKKRITLRHLAQNLDMTEGGLQKLLSREDINTSTLYSISKILELDPAEILFENFSDTNYGQKVNIGRDNNGRIELSLQDCEKKVIALERENELLREMVDLLKERK
jgi:DNA-binding Xre family transcriptional regulator